jgi:uncharacterized protein involved in response to NO
MLQPSTAPTPAPAASVRGWRPFGLGFRPFFLLAGLGALALILLWLLLWHRGARAADYYGALGWHGHEMLFGYATAVIAGFLLTAVRNWTGRPTPTGWPLALLASVWLAGRLLPWIPGLAPLWIAGVDLAFLPLLALALARPLWGGANRVNRWFLPLLLAMALANGLVHAEAMGWAEGLAARGSMLMLVLILLTLVWVGGRVMPFFTGKALNGARPRNRPWVERAGFGLLLLLAALQLAALGGWALGLTAFALASVQAVRLAGWYDHRLWGVPILWVLYTGYLWLIAGFALFGLAALGGFPQNLALHALTLGAIGVFTLGMMARVALGHTGRPMVASKPLVLAFGLLNLAALVRVFAVYLVPVWYVGWILLSGLLWLLAFGAFAVIYVPILLRPRADGRPD